MKKHAIEPSPSFFKKKIIGSDKQPMKSKSNKDFVKKIRASK